MSIAQCPSCNATTKVPFWKIGTSIKCSSCNESFGFRGRAVNHQGNGEYAITYDDFEQVINDYMNLPKAQKLLGKPLGMIVNESGSTITFWSTDGKQIARENIHEMVQTNSKLQREFYNFAMSNWR